MHTLVTSIFSTRGYCSLPPYTLPNWVPRPDIPEMINTRETGTKLYILTKSAITLSAKNTKDEVADRRSTHENDQRDACYLTESCEKTPKPSANTSQVNHEKAYLLSPDVTQIARPQSPCGPVIRGSIV